MIGCLWFCFQRGNPYLAFSGLADSIGTITVGFSFDSGFIIKEQKLPY
jgi:hypothetical protein